MVLFSFQTFFSLLPFVLQWLLSCQPILQSLSGSDKNILISFLSSTCSCMVVIWDLSIMSESTLFRSWSQLVHVMDWGIILESPWIFCLRNKVNDGLCVTWTPGKVVWRNLFISLYSGDTCYGGIVHGFRLDMNKFVFDPTQLPIPSVTSRNVFQKVV